MEVPRSGGFVLGRAFKPAPPALALAFRRVVRLQPNHLDRHSEGKAVCLQHVVEVDYAHTIGSRFSFSCAVILADWWIHALQEFVRRSTDENVRSGGIGQQAALIDE